ncbi:pleckstrin homology domain-containing family G member 4B [Aptenodytes patagonicus]|uniref:pleckstrin homology domain-containing family G member 4B n=1 Tax=Aptenodytes patagonicus TaxID=9234 RepID=UPI003FA17166
MTQNGYNGASLRPLSNVTPTVKSYDLEKHASGLFFHTAPGDRRSRFVRAAEGCAESSRPASGLPAQPPPVGTAGLRAGTAWPAWKKICDLGVVILVDSRKCQPVSSLFKALTAMQNAIPHSIHSVLVLTDKECAFRPHWDTAIQKLEHFITNCKEAIVFLQNSQPTYNQQNSQYCARSA